MAVKYQIDGNIFLEINTNWLCASINEFLIKARQLDTDLAGNTVEHVQLNDGRIFTRLVSSPKAVASKSRPQNIRQAIHEQSLTQPR
jgi:hypothetical protein